MVEAGKLSFSWGGRRLKTSLGPRGLALKSKWFMLSVFYGRNSTRESAYRPFGEILGY
jgi:hypothetical protein